MRTCAVAVELTGRK